MACGFFGRIYARGALLTGPNNAATSLGGVARLDWRLEECVVYRGQGGTRGAPAQDIMSVFWAVSAPAPVATK